MGGLWIGFANSLDRVWIGFSNGFRSVSGGFSEGFRRVFVGLGVFSVFLLRVSRGVRWFLEVFDDF